MSIFVQRMGIVDSIISVYDANVNANTGADLFNFGGALSEKSVTGSPTAGSGVLSINSNSVGAYDFMILNGPLTPNQATVDSWIEATADTRSAWIVIIGDLTIGAGVTMTPSVRKLMMVLFVTGDLVLAGEISMSQRGANHSATTAVAIAVYTGVTIGATGGAGATGRTNSLGVGAAGSLGVNNAAGGGGAGASSVNADSRSGSGAAGTCFSGGPGGGSESSNFDAFAGNGVANGGAGGAGSGSASWAGGAGNPGGDGNGNGSDGSAGTGGTLSIFCLGDFSGNGSITAAGANGGNATSTVGGGGSGGGVVTLYVGTDSSTITPTAPGGAGGTASTYAGGAGGAGSVQTGLIV